MGFLICNSAFMVPKIILQARYLLGFLKQLICYLFSHLGLAHFIESDVLCSELIEPKFKPLTAMLIKEKLPVVRFQDLGVDDDDDDDDDDKVNGCAVCLVEFEGRDEIRRLFFCQHMFHRKCLDRWIDHGQKTCPLCRTDLIVKVV